MAKIPTLSCAPPRTPPTALSPAVLSPAVLLNGNARGVTPSTLKCIAQALPEAHVSLSHNFSEAHEIARKILTHSHAPVLFGGGDGTFMGFLEAFLKASKQLGKPLPELGLLRLGTGNAIARWAGQTRGGKHALLQALAHISAKNKRSYKNLNLVEVEGRMAPFAGAGLDGKLLGDYVRFKERSSQKPWKRVASGMKGYLTSATFQTIPYYLKHSTQTHCQIQNLGETAHRVHPDGSLGPRLPKGALLYEGMASMVAVGTIPFYGYGIRMFPFAELLPRGMHLRILHLSSIPRLLLNLYPLWKGRWFPQGMYDFVVDNVMLSCAKPMACQVGGDAVGERTRMQLKLSEISIPLIHFGNKAAASTL